MRRWSEGPLGTASLTVLLLKSPVRMTAPSFIHIAEEQQQRNADGPSLGALVVDVNIGDRETRARRVRHSAELASNNHSLDGPRRAPERARDLARRVRVSARKSILVAENNAMVLGDHVEVLRQGTVGDEASTLLYVDHMPRPIEVRGQQARIQTSCTSRVPGEELQSVRQTSVALIRTKSKTIRATGRLFQELGSRLPICVKVRNESGVPVCRAGLLVSHASIQSLSSSR